MARDDRPNRVLASHLDTMDDLRESLRLSTERLHARLDAFEAALVRGGATVPHVLGAQPLAEDRWGGPSGLIGRTGSTGKR